MLSVKNLTLAYTNEILKNISFDLRTSNLFALLGPNGSGKTTLLYAIYGIIPDEIECNVDGRISIFGKRPSEFKDKFFMFQDIENELIGPTVMDDVLINAKTEEDAVKALKEMAIYKLRNKDVFEISYGEKLRTLLSAAISSKAKLIILDEPTSSLDFSVAENLFKLLRKMSKERIIIVSTHDTYLAYKYATKVGIIKDRKILFGKELLKKAKQFGLRPLRI